ncbi:MAG TPA: hypothetical protein VEX87_12075 [Skermanella sp.]|jgi:hypothetical protein|nr:hypothetical protein [Skermanella sp.]
MSTYQGTFSVQNLTGFAITNLTVMHTCNNNVDVIPSSTLAIGATSETAKLNSDDGYDDFWTVCYTLGDNVYSFAHYNCNFEESDTGGLCSIVLSNTQSFSVDTPESPSCSGIGLSSFTASSVQ